MRKPQVCGPCSGFVVAAEAASSSPSLPKSEPPTPDAIGTAAVPLLSSAEIACWCPVAPPNRHLRCLCPCLASATSRRRSPPNSSLGVAPSSSGLAPSMSTQATRSLLSLLCHASHRTVAFLQSTSSFGQRQQW